MIFPLDLKPINELLGNDFYIPYYQRGYRWTDQQVNDLLNDIWAFTSKGEKFYCLQPIVVKKRQWEENGKTLVGFEVIDGQQRLTTIYIIVYYLAKEYLKVESLVDDYGKELYTLRYQTRPLSEMFLKNITNNQTNIDFYYIWSAYETVRRWFTEEPNKKDRSDKEKFLRTLLGKKTDERSVQIIWYEVDRVTNGIELFTRLNIGKIPLTNSELIKALFLSTSSFINENEEDAIKKKIEISQLWDDMEQKLSDEAFWSFITNAKQKDYSTKIELLFDMIAGRESNQIDPLFTFLFFLKESKETRISLWDLWLSIEQYYLTLSQWFKDKNLYHKIGYLITVGEDLRELIELSMKIMKSEFEKKLDDRIANSISFDIDQLSYQKSSDYNKIERILILFNVESIRTNNNNTEFYPFKFHKSTQWSLEHIHAQNSESLDKTKQDPWIKWLNYHEALIQELYNDERNLQKRQEWQQYLSEIKDINNEKLTWETFSNLSNRIAAKFSENSVEDSTDLHSISNLALLSQMNNSALNNAVFEVKRREIISIDKSGGYIPVCTRRVFLKYYNNKPTTQQYYFWGKEDRGNYYKEIKSVLNKYILFEDTNSN